MVDLDWSHGKPERLPQTERELPAQLVLLACGFTGPEAGVFGAFDVPIAEHGRPLPTMAEPGGHRCARGGAAASAEFQGRDVVPVYAAGDARNGSSLVVSAMADALKCAAEVAEDLGL